MSHRHRAYPNPDHSGLQPLTVEEAYSNLVTSLDRIVADYPSAISSRHALSGFYYGPTSLSFLFLALSGLFPDLTVNSKSLRYWSKAYLEVSLSYKQHNPDPNDCGVANEKLTTLALTAALDQDKSAAERLCSYVPKLLNTRSREGSCEWLYGLSGFLYLLRLCRSHLPQTSHIVEPAIQEITSYILRQPLPWKWHEKEYLGAVHGTIGIITQIVLSSPLPEILQQLSPLLSSCHTTYLGELSTFHEFIAKRCSCPILPWRTGVSHLIPFVNAILSGTQIATYGCNSERREMCYWEGSTSEDSFFVSWRLWKCISFAKLRYAQTLETNVWRSITVGSRRWRWWEIWIVHWGSWKMLGDGHGCKRHRRKNFGL